MKLYAKLYNKYMKQILEGKKKEEFRQVESIVFRDEDGNEYEYEVKRIGVVSHALPTLKRMYPDVSWKNELWKSTIKIFLGRRIR